MNSFEQRALKHELHLLVATILTTMERQTRDGSVINPAYVQDLRIDTGMIEGRVEARIIVLFPEHKDFSIVDDDLIQRQGFPDGTHSRIYFDGQEEPAQAKPVDQPHPENVEPVAQEG